MRTRMLVILATLWGFVTLANCADNGGLGTLQNATVAQTLKLTTEQSKQISVLWNDLTSSRIDCIQSRQGIKSILTPEQRVLLLAFRAEALKVQSLLLSDIQAYLGISEEQNRKLVLTKQDCDLFVSLARKDDPNCDVKDIISSYDGAFMSVLSQEQQQSYQSLVARVASASEPAVEANNSEEIK